MSAQQTAPQNIDEYIAGFPTEVQAILEKIRRTIREAVPDAEETIKYQMPTFTLKGNLVYFAAFKKHIGFYPPATGDEKFKAKISVYEGAKGNLRFPLDEVELQVGADKFAARARTATNKEKPRLWKRMSKIFPQYDKYQARAAKASRDIPLVIVEPV